MNKLLLGTVVGLLTFLLLYTKSPDIYFPVTGETVYGSSPQGLLMNLLIAVGVGILAWGLLFGWDSVRNAGNSLRNWAEGIKTQVQSGAKVQGKAPVHTTEDEDIILELYRTGNWELLELKGNLDKDIRQALASTQTKSKNAKST